MGCYFKQKYKLLPLTKLYFKKLQNYIIELINIVEKDHLNRLFFLKSIRINELNYFGNINNQTNDDSKNRSNKNGSGSYVFN